MITTWIVALGLGFAGSAPIGDLWHTDTEGAISGLPLVTDYNNDGVRNVVASEQKTGTLWVLGAGGELVHRIGRPDWLAGSASCGSECGRMVAEESTGRITLLDYLNYKIFISEARGEPLPTAGPCVEDLEGDGTFEVISARRNGDVVAYTGELSPIWTFNAGDPIEAPIAVAQIYESCVAVFVRTRTGRLHALTGKGAPLWRQTLRGRDPRGGAGPLVLQFGAGPPVVVVTTDDGSVCAFDAARGTPEWTCRPARSPLGAPAVIDLKRTGRQELLLVSAGGELVVLDSHGEVVHSASLPLPKYRGPMDPRRAEGQNPAEPAYVPNPLVADVDADGNLEVVITDNQWGLNIFSLEGILDQRIELRGSATAGAVMDDQDGDGRLEIFAGTDCARIYGFQTEARDGWTHPRGDMTNTGAFGLLTRLPVPEEDPVSRAVRIRAATVGDRVEGESFMTAVIQIEPVRAARRMTAVVRTSDTIAGALSREVTDAPFAVPFVQQGTYPLSLDVTLYDEDGKAVARTEGKALRAEAVRLAELASVEEFGAALDECGRRFAEKTAREAFRRDDLLSALVSQVRPPDKEPTKAPGSTRTRIKVEDVTIGGDMTCASRRLALASGIDGWSGASWMVHVDGSFQGARHAPEDTVLLPTVDSPVYWRFPATASGPGCGHSVSLLTRLYAAAMMARPDEVGLQGIPMKRDSSDSPRSSVNWPELDQALTPLDTALREEPLRKAQPFRPVAFVAESSPERLIGGTLSETGSANDDAAVFDHVFGGAGQADFERGFFCTNDYGEVFAILPTDGVAAEGLTHYPVAWPLGTTFLEGLPHDARSDEVARLEEYVRDGGILVVNAPVAALLPEGMLQAKFTSRDELGTQIQTALVSNMAVAAPYRFREIGFARKAEVLAWTGAGEPILFWRRIDKGVLIVSATERWCDEAGRLLPLAPALLDAIVPAFLPVACSEGVHFTLSRTGQGWLVALFNNQGVEKNPTTAAVTDAAQSRECFVEFRDGVPLKFDTILGNFGWDNEANSLRTRIEPGGTAIVHAQFSRKPYP